MINFFFIFEEQLIQKKKYGIPEKEQEHKLNLPELFTSKSYFLLLFFRQVLFFIVLYQFAVNCWNSHE